MIDIRPWLNQTIAIEPRSTANGYGEQSYGASATHNCRIQRSWSMRRTSDGEAQVSDTIVFLAPTATVSIDDRVTLEGQIYNVTKVTKRYDGAGTLNHLEIVLGRDA